MARTLAEIVAAVKDLRRAFARSAACPVRVVALKKRR
jgi:hypothetical protein